MMRVTSRLMRLLPLAIALVFGGCRDRAHVLAVVLGVKGDVEQVAPAHRRLAPGDFVAPPASLRSTAQGAFVVAALPGVMLRLEGAGELSLETLALHKRVDEMGARTARVALREGRFHIWIDDFRSGSVDLRIQTPAGELEFRGPVLAELVVGATGDTRLVCVSGTVLAGGLAVSGGQWTTLAAASPPSAVQLAADRNEVWQALLRAREIERQFVELQARQRERTPIQGLNSTAEAAKN